MFEAVGHPVLKLKRIAYGQLELGDLASGKYRFLGPGDIKMIFRKWDCLIAQKAPNGEVSRPYGIYIVRPGDDRDTFMEESKFFFTIC